VFYRISAWHFLYRLACSVYSLTSQQDAGKYEVTDICQGEGTHALTRKLRLIYSCNFQKRLRQFDQIAPRIAEKRETQRETGRVPRFADNPHITAFQFTDRGIDILDAQAQVVLTGDRMGIDQLVVLGTRRAAGTGDQLDAKTVVSSRGEKSQRFFAQCHRADQAKIERAGVPGGSDLKVRHAQSDMVASP
jgi:hypothetical protein